MTYQMVLLRHGESQWNRENRFTGWTDVDLSAQGVDEAKQAGQAMVAAGLTFDMAFSSVLKRACRTLHLALAEMGLDWIAIERSWRLNERHYGALQGLDKREMALQFGEDQVLAWRRSYDTPPPPLNEDDERHPRFDSRYAGVPMASLPGSECLRDTVARVIPYWQDAIAPQLLAGKRVLVAAHGNSIRAFVKYLDGVSDADIVGLNIPTGVPLLYTFNERLEPQSSRYLGDPDAVAAAAKAVAEQGKGR